MSQCFVRVEMEGLEIEIALPKQQGRQSLYAMYLKVKEAFSCFAGNVLRNLTFLWRSSSIILCFFILSQRFLLFWLSLLREAGVLIILLTLSCKLNIGRLYTCVYFPAYCPFIGQLQQKLLPPFFWPASNCRAGKSPLKIRSLSVKINPFEVDNSSFSSKM